jgi:MYXO-CTERM domain-containing protein
LASEPIGSRIPFFRLEISHMLSMNRMAVSSAVASLVFASAASAAVVFDNLANRSTNIYSVSGTSNVTWYAVYADNASDQATLDLNQLKVSIYKSAGFAGCTLNAFVATANGTDLANALPTLVAPGSTAPAYTSIGTISLSANGGSSAVSSTATFGDGVTTKASIALNNSWSTHGCFFVGFQFVGNSATPSLRAALHRSTGTTAGSATTTVGYVDNTFWSSTSSVTGAVTGPSGFTSSTTSSNVGCVSVAGNLVPAPGALALLGVAGLIGSRRRR